MQTDCPVPWPQVPATYASPESHKLSSYLTVSLKMYFNIIFHTAIRLRAGRSGVQNLVERPTQFPIQWIPALFSGGNAAGS
jgi:hypothetical protein